MEECAEAAAGHRVDLDYGLGEEQILQIYRYFFDRRLRIMGKRVWYSLINGETLATGWSP